MPRKPRIEVPAGVFHLTSRGNRKQSIYVDDHDRRMFLDLFALVVEQQKWLCHSFVLMSNHFHLLVQTPEMGLSVGMQRLNGRYADWFNGRHELDGHLFQGRFHSVLVESDRHLLEVARYVVANPVRAGICRDAGDWPWSSYRATVGQVARPRFLTTDWLLHQFGRDLERARGSYAQFVREAPPKLRLP